MSWRLKIHETVFHMSNFMSQICELFVYDSVWLMREDPWLQTVTVEVKNNKKEREKKVTHGMKMTLILLIKIMITASSFSLLIRLAWIMACGWIWPLVLPPCSVQPNSLDFQHAYGLICDCIILDLIDLFKLVRRLIGVLFATRSEDELHHRLTTAKWPCSCIFFPKPDEWSCQLV